MALKNPRPTQRRHRARRFAALSEALEHRLLLADFTVTNVDDSGAGSFRQALTDAIAAASVDVILFSSFFNTPRTISLLTALPLITAAGGALTITGPGASLLTIRRDPGAATSFRIFDSATGTLTITGMTVTGGNPATFGGGLQVAGTTPNVTIDGVVFTGNSPAAGGGGIALISVNSFLTLRNSTISNNTAGGFGGGIDWVANAGGSFVIENSTISGNTAGISISTSRGGGIYFSGVASAAPPAGFTPSTLVIRNSTITGNTAPESGGGIGINNVTGTLLVQNSTITGNTSTTTTAGQGGGGIGRTGGTSTITVQNSIVSGNTNVNGPDILSTGTVNVNFSAVGSNTGFVLSGTSGNNLAFGTNLLLGTLGNNGGPTQTILPALTSPVLDVGSNALIPAGVTTDQRGTGFLRSVNGIVDIGAVELQRIVVTTNADSGAGSLRQAVLDANTSGADTTIVFSSFFSSPRTISLLTTLPAFAAAGGGMTISGTGALNLMVRRDPTAATTFGVFDSQAPTVNISGMTIAGGNTTADGGGLNIGGTGSVATLDDVIVRDNSATGDGGGINVDSGGFLTLRNSTVTGNTAAGAGGGIYFFSGGSLVMENSTISGNSSTGIPGGGGIYFFGTVSASPPPGFTASALVVRNSTIANNRSTNSGGSGGGIVLISFTGTLLVQNSTITGNTANSVLAGQGGGGIARTSGTGTITLANTVVSGNTNANAPDILSTGTVNVNFSAVGSATGFTPSGSSGNNLAFGADLRLGTHGNFGGVTQTFFPRQGSPLINAGSNGLIPGGVSTDQRGSGFARIDGGTVDIGAVETQNLIIVVNTFNSGAGSLGGAIAAANATSIIDNIIFDPSVFNVPHTITLTTALPVISNNLTIFGPGASLLTVRRSPGAPNFAVFNATAGIVNLFGMTVSNGNGPVDGGGVTHSGVGRPNVTLDGMVVTGNNALQDGAGVNISVNGFLTVRNSTISGNTAVEDGGGIYMLSNGSLVVENSSITGNTATGDDGGGIYFFGTASLNVPVGFTPGVLVVRNSTIANNTAAGGSSSGGGGIGLLSFTGTLLVQNSTISGNTANATLAGSGGGGIGRQSGTGSVTLQNSIVSGNTNVNGPDLFFNTATTINANFSAIGSATGNFALSGTSGNNLAFGTNLMLGALGNNGGPTQTLLPGALSPVIGAGSNALIPAGVTNDQRGPGFARISGAVVDIGAVERDDIAPTVQTSDLLFLTAPQALRYVFSENVGASLAVADLLLENLTTTQTISSANIALSFNSATNTATFTFPGFPFGALPDGDYRATLIASGIADSSGNPLDGDGNGTSGDNHFFNFFFLNGDPNRDRRVNLLDFNILAANFGQSPRNFSLGDFNYDTIVNLIDFNILAARFGNTLAGLDGSIFGESRIGVRQSVEELLN